MLLKSLFLKAVFLFAALLLLTHCAKMPAKQSSTSLESATPYTLPVSAYLALAKNQPGEEKQTLLIMAAGRSLYEHNWQQARDILTQTDDLSSIQRDQKNILLAETELLQNQPQEAIVCLSKIENRRTLSLFYQTEFHQTLARAYDAVGNASESLSERIKLQGFMANEASRKKNSRAIWSTLNKLPKAELDTMALEAKPESDLQGWTRLALVSRQSGFQNKSLVQQVQEWQTEFPAHPGNSLLPASLNDIDLRLQNTAQKIALLLPLSGSLTGPGNAVRDGFMAAYNASNPEKDVDVRFYDTAKGNVSGLYQQAIEEGADFVIGPLTKNDVTTIAHIEHPVPTLLLNDMSSISKNAYSFGLSPVGEAQQVADKARKNGLQRALIIAPEGAWADDIVTAFSKQWQQTGGSITDKFRFNPHMDLSQGVRQFLQVSEHDAHEKQPKASDPSLPVAAKRRQDFDMIFLLAYSSSARQIMPLLKYYFAGDIPVYATSSVYAASTNSLRDKDLDGIIFCDMPWVFHNSLPDKNWPDQFNSYSRLYALGMDSHLLVSRFSQLALFPEMGIKAKNGMLYLDQGQQIHRVLAWGKFKGGIAMPWRPIS